MYYVEFLRVLRGLRVIAIILGVFFLLAVIVRITFGADSHTALIAQIRSSPTAVVHQQTLPDGTIKTTIDDAVQRAHVNIFDRGPNGSSYDITVPSELAAKEHFSIYDDSTTRRNSITTIAGGSSDSVDLSWLFLASIVPGLIIATVLGGPFAKENNGHLELAWTKPVSRERYALTTIGVDIAGILAAQVLSVVVFFAMIAIFNGEYFYVGSHAVQIITTSLLGPIAWYGLITICSASIKARGAVIGIVWPAAIVIPLLAQLYNTSQPLAHAIGAFFRVVNLLNPFMYFTTFSNGSVQVGGTAGGSLIPLTAATSISMLVILALLYLAAAVVQWRRVEA